MPSKGAVGCFTLFENGLAPPPLPSFTEVVAKGRQQEIIKGRESPLSDFICVLSLRWLDLSASHDRSMCLPLRAFVMHAHARVHVHVHVSHTRHVDT